MACQKYLAGQYTHKSFRVLSVCKQCYYINWWRWFLTGKNMFLLWNIVSTHCTRMSSTSNLMVLTTNQSPASWQISKIRFIKCILTCLEWSHPSPCLGWKMIKTSRLRSSICIASVMTHQNSHIDRHNTRGLPVGPAYARILFQPRLSVSSARIEK